MPSRTRFRARTEAPRRRPDADAVGVEIDELEAAVLLPGRGRSRRRGRDGAGPARWSAATEGGQGREQRPQAVRRRDFGRAPGSRESRESRSGDEIALRDRPARPALEISQRTGASRCRRPRAPGPRARLWPLSTAEDERLELLEARRPVSSSRRRKRLRQARRQIEGDDQVTASQQDLGRRVADEYRGAA